MEASKPAPLPGRRDHDVLVYTAFMGHPPKVCPPEELSTPDWLQAYRARLAATHMLDGWTGAALKRASNWAQRACQQERARVVLENAMRRFSEARNRLVPRSPVN